MSAKTEETENPPKRQIMEAIANMVLQCCSNCCSDPLNRIYNDIKNYNENLSSLKAKAGTLDTRRDDVEKSVAAASISGEEIKSEVKNWVRRAKDLSAAEENLTAAAGQDTRCICGCFPDYNRRRRHSKKAARLCGHIDAILAEPRFDSVSHFRNGPIVPAFTRPAVENFEMFSATETALEKVMAALRTDGVGVIGVYGTGGIGKTTAMEEAVVMARNEGLFDKVAFLTISKSLNTMKLQTRIAEALGLTLGEYNSSITRASIIKERFMKETRVLVVLDDIWQEFDLDSIGVPKGSELAACESKILLTTRIENVCYRMGCLVKVRLDLWTEPESWVFFKKTAGTDFNSQKFEDTAKMVANECRGLPLALVAVAKALGDKDEEEWDKALKRLMNSMPPNDDDDGLVFNSLMLSFDFLKAKEKACFLVCCLFPEDHNVEKEELARYLFGLELFPDANTIEDARGDTYTITKKLIASGLLLCGNEIEQQVKMHDVIRDFAIQLTSPLMKKKIGNGSVGWAPMKKKIDVGSEEWAEEQVFIVQTGSHTLKEWPLRDSYEGFTGISVINKGICELIDDSPNCVKLQTLLLQDNNLREISATFFENMAALKVLDASKIESPSLPLSIKSLKKLRTLHLDCCKFCDISMLGELEKLAILSLKQSIIEELPQDIGKLSKLRLLDLTLTLRIKRIQPNIFSSLRFLEELYLKGSFSQWHDGTDPETSQNACFSELVNLRRLIILSVDIEYAKCLPQHVNQIPNWQKFNISLCKGMKGRMFGVHSNRNGDCSTNMLLDTSMKNLPGWFNEIASERTKKLTYWCCGALNLMEEHKVGRLSGLKSLIVDDCKVVNYLISPLNQTTPDHSPVFESLQDLRLHELEKMEGICSGNLPIGSLKNLTFMEVQECPNIHNSLLTSNLIQRASNLERLRVTNSSPTEIFEFENLDEGLYLGSLREMRLENVNKLETVWKGPARFADFRKLRLVSIIRCKKLKSLFSVSIPEGLSELEDLWLEGCLLIEEVIRNEGSANLKNVRLPKLKTLCLMKLPKLTSFYAGNAVLECPSLEYVHVHGCPNYKISIPEFNSLLNIQENDDQHMKNLSKRMTKPEY